MCRRGKKNRRISDSVKLFKIIAIIHIFHKIKKNKIFSKKVLTFLWKAVIIYLVKRTTAKTTKKCRSGGIGRRAGFRCLWSQDRVGSSPISCIIFFLLLRIPELRIRLAVRHRMSLLFRLGSSSFFLLCNFFQHNRIFFCSYFVEKSILL